MFNRFIRLPNLALLSLCAISLQINLANAQSVELSWQQTASNKSNDLAQFDQYALHGDFQALLLGIERRVYQRNELSSGAATSIEHLSIGVQYFSQITDLYAIWPRLQIMAGYDNQMTSDSLTYNPQLVGIRTLTKDIAIVLGGGALIHTAENQYYPVFGIVLQASEGNRWSGNLTIPQGEIIYQVSEGWFAEAGLKWQTRYYKTDRSFVGTEFLRTQETLVSAGVRKDLSTQLRLSARLSYAFSREARLYSVSTGSPMTENPASGLGFLLSMSYHF